MRYRLEVRFRHECFIAGIVASDYRNAHRQSTSDKLISPLDYVVCEEMSKEEIAAMEKEQNEQAMQTLLGMNGVREKKA
jgi:hypothetical protein